MSFVDGFMPVACLAAYDTVGILLKNNAQCPTGTEPPYSAEFRLDFTLPDGPTPTATGRILADDYFALYVNGVLADSCTGFDFSSSSPCLGRTVHGAAAWLDDRLVGQPRAADVPLLVDFSLYLHTHGELNEIFIFACNGDAPTPRVPAGATPDQAPIGCPNPPSIAFALDNGSQGLAAIGRERPDDEDVEHDNRQ